MEVRTIAHHKNSHVQISKGLILATKAVANQISETSKLHIDVINVDVYHYINNTIEIQVFRVIQELLTNVIKQANASEVNIQFSKDENMLVVMVEDNGRGFDINETVLGYGLSNIEKRVEKINGNINIDSSLGNGTTIILNIPL
jgi:signal transduction histidine kinase